ncbi:hypothetical protein K438DRAFT_1756659 [Mycena galopus ATCC 62051]|nr:hypothetical protein K438DRAFT_1756659 [Mycena galopus ATCC 62051]
MTPSLLLRRRGCAKPRVRKARRVQSVDDSDPESPSEAPAKRAKKTRPVEPAPMKKNGKKPAVDAAPQSTAVTARGRKSTTGVTMTKGQKQVDADAAIVVAADKKKGKKRAVAIRVSEDPAEHTLQFQTAFEDDEYDTDEYEVQDDERRNVELIAYTDRDQPAIRRSLHLRAVSHLNVKRFPIAKFIRAVSDSDMGPLPVDLYFWYCPLLNQWIALHDSAINFRPRGAILILRKASVPEAHCVDIVERMVEALMSVLALAGDSDDGYFTDDDDEPEFPERIPIPSSSSTKRKRSPSPADSDAVELRTNHGRRSTSNAQVIDITSSDY